MGPYFTVDRFIPSQGFEVSLFYHCQYNETDSNMHQCRSIDPASTIFVSEPALQRRELALNHGATHVIDPLAPSASGLPSPATVPSAILKATNGLGVDIAFDAAGIQASVDAALQSLRPKGTFVNVAIWEIDPKISMNLVLMRELNITGTPPS
jgi:threonine dehydrogenase-like Zn-dependent dehydrogenase